MKRSEIVILPRPIYHIALQWRHVISMACQITSNFTVCSTVCSSAHQIKHQRSASLAFVMGIHRWPVDSPHTGPVTRKIFSFDDVFMVYQMASYLPSTFHCHIQNIYAVVFTKYMSACILVFVRVRGPSQYKDVVLPVQGSPYLEKTVFILRRGPGGLAPIKPWIRNYICCLFMWDVITHPCHLYLIIRRWS